MRVARWHTRGMRFGGHPCMMGFGGTRLCAFPLRTCGRFSFPSSLSQCVFRIIDGVVKAPIVDATHRVQRACECPVQLGRGGKQPCSWSNFDVQSGPTDLGNLAPVLVSYGGVASAPRLLPRLAHASPSSSSAPTTRHRLQSILTHGSEPHFGHAVMADAANLATSSAVTSPTNLASGCHASAHRSTSTATLSSALAGLLKAPSAFAPSRALFQGLCCRLRT